MESEKLKFAMVGCGEVSHEHAKAMQSVQRAEFTACCDISRSKAESWKLKYNCRNAYDNLDAMLAAEKPDAVVLATWPKQHPEQMRNIVESGIKNILCEKSMTTSAAEALEIYRMCRRENVFILEACKSRYHPVYSKIEELLAGDELGRIDNINATFSNFEPDYLENPDKENWRYKKDRGGGVSWDWMTYLVNAANNLSGSVPTKVFASGSISSRFNVVTRMYGIIEYKNGIAATVASSKNASFSTDLEVVCEKGRILSPLSWAIFGDVTLECRKRQPDWPFIIKDLYEIKHRDCFVLQLESFIDVMQGKGEPVIPLEDTVKNICTIELLERSLEEGKLLYFDIPEDLK